MKLQKYIPYIVVLAMIGIAVFCIRNSPEITILRDSAVVESLPDRVGDWVGESLSYCQNESCMKMFISYDLSDTKRCPACGGILMPAWSLSERRLLPADTVLLRKLYRSAFKPSLLVSIVISSSEEVSIHRPQMCLTGQGYDIADETIQEIPLRNRGPLRVAMMSLFHRRPDGGGRSSETPGFYAYWFLCEGYETPSGMWRIAHATWNRVVHGRVYRWAYVSISGDQKLDTGLSNQQFKSFVGELYPLIRVEPRI